MEKVKRRTPAEMEKTKKEILAFCKGKHRTMREISEHTGIHFDTLRSKYVYRLVREERLIPGSPKNRCRSYTTC